VPGQRRLAGGFASPELLAGAFVLTLPVHAAAVGRRQSSALHLTKLDIACAEKWLANLITPCHTSHSVLHCIRRLGPLCYLRVSCRRQRLCRNRPRVSHLRLHQYVAILRLARRILDPDDCAE
jgi:hypothetical protein